MQLVIILGLIRIISAVRCEYCGEDFGSIGRHVWRCKARVTSSARPLQAGATPIADSPPLQADPRAGLPPVLPAPPDAPEDVQCPCGRQCKGRKGLKAHQRSCAFFKTLVQGGPSDQTAPAAHQPPAPSADHDDPPPSSRTSAQSLVNQTRPQTSKNQVGLERS